MQIVALEDFLHTVLTKHRVFGGLSSCKRITPRSRSLGLHPSFPVKGHLNRFTGFRIAHKIKLLLTSPYRSGLQYPEVPTMPSADSWGAIKAIAGPSVRFGPLSSPDTPQASRGKFMSFRCTTAGFTPWAFDGYGLRDLMLTRPTEAPRIQFLFVGSHLCYTLPSDPISRRRPCASLAFTSIRLAEGLSPSKCMNMPGTHEDSPQQATGYQKEDYSEPARSKLRGIAPKEIKVLNHLTSERISNGEGLSRTVA